MYSHFSRFSRSSGNPALSMLNSSLLCWPENEKKNQGAFALRDCGECTSARSQSDRCIQSKTTWLMFIHPNFVYKPKNFPKFQSFFFFKNTPKYDKLSKISNISIKTMLELRTKFGNFGNFGHISDGLRKQYPVRTQCCNLIGSEPLYIPCIDGCLSKTFIGAVFC